MDEQKLTALRASVEELARQVQQHCDQIQQLRDQQREVSKLLEDNGYKCGGQR